MATDEAGAKLMCQWTLHVMYSQQLAFSRYRELCHNLAARRARSADLLRQRTTSD